MLNGDLKGRAIVCCFAAMLASCGDNLRPGGAPPPLDSGLPEPVPADVVAPPPGATTTSSIDAAGGTQRIDGVVQVIWPPNSLASPAMVTLAATATAVTDDDFNQTALVFQPAGKRLYEIRVNTGPVLPSASIRATIAIPGQLLDAMPPDTGVQAFIQFLEEGGDDSIDGFELVASRVDLSARTVELEIPAEAFTASRTVDNRYEAIFTLGITPGTNLVLNPTRRGDKAAASATSDRCAASSVGSPLANVEPADLAVRDRFDPPMHYGVDLAAKDGDGVVAVADGTILKTGYQLSKTKKNRFGQPSGWGYYVVLQRGDGSTITYAHLQQDSITGLVAGAAVKQGDMIARADSSGGVTGPHLHLEYAPNGKWYSRPDKIDPLPCIGATVAGSINVGDNGNIADDSFTVSVDGNVLGTTTIGGKNNIAVSNLRPGSHQLNIVCVVAPDNVGTLGISLADGWTFQNGSTTLSAVLTLNQSADYTFVVPAAN